MNETCHLPGCPCREFALKTPSEASSTTEIPREPKNVITAPDPVYGAGNGIPAPTFEQEWESAPRAMIRYVERSIAEYWFLRGIRAGEAGAMVTMNDDLKEIRRVAGERLATTIREGR